MTDTPKKTIIFHRLWFVTRKFVIMRTLSLLIPCVLVVYVSASCLPGGSCPVTDVNNPEIQTMAQFALTTYAAKSNALCDADFKVKHAETQVVAGINYRLTVEATCGGQTTVCQFSVFDQSWTNTRELSSSHCSHGHKRLARAGGLSPADTSSDQFMDAMGYAASQVDAQTNSMFRVSPVHFSHCFQQVVAGMKYVCDVTFGENSCAKGDTTYLSLCSVNSKGFSSTWHVEIVSQPWMPTKYTLQQLTFKH